MSAPHQLSRILGVWSPDDAFSMLRCQLCLQKGAEQFELLQKLTSTSSSVTEGVMNRGEKFNTNNGNRNLNPRTTKEPPALDGASTSTGIDALSDSSSSLFFSFPSSPSLIDFLERHCAGVTHEEQKRVDEKGVMLHRRRGYASAAGGGGLTAMRFDMTQSLSPLYQLSTHALSATKKLLFLFTNRAENSSTEEGNKTTTTSSDSPRPSTESSTKSKKNIMRREPVCPVSIVSPCASSAYYYEPVGYLLGEGDDDLMRDLKKAEAQAHDRSPSWRTSSSRYGGGGGRRWAADPVMLFTKCATRVVAEETAAESARKTLAEDYDAFTSIFTQNSPSAAKKGEVTGHDGEKSKKGSTAENTEKVPYRGGLGRSDADNGNGVATSAALAAGSTASNRKSEDSEGETDSSFPLSSPSLFISNAFGTLPLWGPSSSFVGSLLSSKEDAESDLMRRIGNEQIAETARHDEALITAYEKTMKEKEKVKTDNKLQEHAKDAAAAIATAFADDTARNGGVVSMPQEEGGSAASSEDVCGLLSLNAADGGAVPPPTMVGAPQKVSPSSSPSSPDMSKTEAHTRAERAAAGNAPPRPPKTAHSVTEPTLIDGSGSEILLPKTASANSRGTTTSSPSPPTIATATAAAAIPDDDLLLDPLYLAYLLSVTSTSGGSSSSAGRPTGAVLGNNNLRTASSTSSVPSSYAPSSSFAFSSPSRQPNNAIFTAPLSSSLSANANNDHHQHLQQVLHYYYDPSSPQRPLLSSDSLSSPSSPFQSLFSSPAFYQLFSAPPSTSLSTPLSPRGRRRRRFDSVAPTLFSIRGGYPIEKALLEAASNILAAETAMERMEEKLVTFLSRHEEKIKSEVDAGKRKVEADAKREEEDRNEKQRVATGEAEAEAKRVATEKEKKAERKRRAREKRLERQRIKREKENEEKEKAMRRAAERNTQHRHDPSHVDPAKVGATATTAAADGSAMNTFSPAVGESLMKAKAGDGKGEGVKEREGSDSTHTRDNNEETGRVVIRMSLLRLPLYAWHVLTSPIVLNTARYSVWLPCELAVGAIRIAYYVSNFPFQSTTPTTSTTATSIGSDTVPLSSTSSTTSGGYLWCSAYLFPTPAVSTTRTAQATSAGVTSQGQGSSDGQDEREDLEDDVDEDADADRESDDEANTFDVKGNSLSNSSDSSRSHEGETMSSKRSSKAPLATDPQSPPHSPPAHDTLTNASVRKRGHDTARGEKGYSFELLMKDIADLFSTANLSKPWELLIALLGAKGSALVVMLISFAFLHYSRQY